MICVDVLSDPHANDATASTPFNLKSLCLIGVRLGQMLSQYFDYAFGSKATPTTILLV